MPFANPSHLVPLKPAIHPTLSISDISGPALLQQAKTLLGPQCSTRRAVSQAQWQQATAAMEPVAACHAEGPRRCRPSCSDPMSGGRATGLLTAGQYRSRAFAGAGLLSRLRVTHVLGGST